jgi:hypothetical protein
LGIRMLDGLAPAQGSEEWNENKKCSYPKLDKMREEEGDHSDNWGVIGGEFTLESCSKLVWHMCTVGETYSRDQWFLASWSRSHVECHSRTRQRQAEQPVSWFSGDSARDTYVWVSVDNLLDRRLESVAFWKDVKSDTLESSCGMMSSNKFFESFLAAPADNDGWLRREIQNCKSKGTTYPRSGSNDQDALTIVDARHDGGASFVGVDW